MIDYYYLYLYVFLFKCLYDYYYLHIIIMYMKIHTALSQKGDPVDSFKVLSARTQVDPVTQREYLLVDISYSLNTQAGFVIDRRGVVSVTSVGSFNQVHSIYLLLLIIY